MSRRRHGDPIERPGETEAERDPCAASVATPDASAAAVAPGLQWAAAVGNQVVQRLARRTIAREDVLVDLGSATQLYMPNATPEEREQYEEEFARQFIESTFQEIRSEHNDRVVSCLLAEASRRSDLQSQERLTYALRLANACWDVYKGPADGDEQSLGDQSIAADLTGLARIDEEGLIDLGLNPDDFNRPSGYQAALYLDLTPLSETQCMPTYHDVRREFDERYPELAHLAEDLFPDEMAMEMPEPRGDTQPRYVLANRGSEGSGDWGTNLEQGIGLDSEQYEEAVALALAVYDAVGGRVTFTGHSLGGGLASAQALATGAPAVTFNAAGLDPATIRTVSSPGVTERRIAAYYVDGEILSWLQDHPLVMYPLVGIAAFEADAAVGRRAVLSSEPIAERSRAERHSMDSVITALESALADAGS